jgi:hypothetical protein
LPAASLGSSSRSSLYDPSLLVFAVVVVVVVVVFVVVLSL